MDLLLLLIVAAALLALTALGTARPRRPQPRKRQPGFTSPDF